MRTLIVDFDIHNKGTTNLFLPKVLETSVSVTEIVAASNGFADELSDQFIRAFQPISLIPSRSLLFLPAARPTEMMEWQSFVATNEAIVHFFKAAFRAIGELQELDVILIDCYGGIDSLTVAAAGIADDIIIVNEPDVITFGGTLTLFVYLQKKYAEFATKPRFHFVINRIPARYSFGFLSAQYKKNLEKLSIDQNILGYFPYDKLLLETFGDYPFFSELLPDSLFTRKIQLLIATLWRDSGFENLPRISPARAKRVFERTSEAGFAEPEAILRTIVNLPFYMVIPLLLFLGLHFGVGRSLNYLMITAILYTAAAVLLLLTLTIGAFEPVQISRWLLRDAAYRRRKRNLKRQNSAPYRVTMTCFQFLTATIPCLVGVVIVFALAYFGVEARGRIWNSSGNLINIAIWPGEISGLRGGRNYSRLMLNPRATIKPHSDLHGANFSGANFSGVHLTDLNLEGANFNYATLDRSTFDNVDLSGATFDIAFLQGTSFVGTKNKFSNGDAQADFSRAFLFASNGDSIAILQRGGAKIVESPSDEYELAAKSNPPKLPDMIEALILKGSKSDLIEARERLKEFQKSIPQNADPRFVETSGELRLLSLLFDVMASEPQEETANKWCEWVGQHHLLLDWSWKIWDAAIRNKALSPTARKQFSQIEDSAMGRFEPDAFCQGNKVANSISAHSRGN
jgi:uncharacterized protein YjbI with pentapeptide repeats/cellulose biosynthesis protein BcsQ